MNKTWWVDPNELNDEQREIITLPLDGSHLITGPPGSGKTNLLLLRANYMSFAGQPNLLVLVFTRTLKEFIRAGGAQYSFPSSKVSTLMSWQKRFLRSFGVKTQLPKDFDSQREQLLNEIEKLVEEKHLNEIYDAILLDEAQDYLPGEIRLFRRLSKVIFATCHPKQKIYSGDDSTALLESLIPDKHDLHFHYRIGKQICTVADALLTGDSDSRLAPTCNYDEAKAPSSVEYHRCVSLNEQADRIIESLSVQLKAYPDDMFGVICPSKLELKRIWNRISGSPIGSLAVLQISGEHSPFDPHKRICVCTVHGAKGLEFRAVHIAECNRFQYFEYERNLAYTAVTRAKTSLTLYYSAELPGYLETALGTLEPLRDLPPLEAVFGVGKN